jgi:hypothetical protein
MGVFVFLRKSDMCQPTAGVASMRDAMLGVVSR